MAISKLQESPEIMKVNDPVVMQHSAVVAEPVENKNKEKEIIIKFDKPCQIEFVMQNTGDKSPRILHDQKLALSRGTLYKLPVTDSTLNLQTAYVIKPNSTFAEIIRILNIVDGYVTVEPIIHGVIINNNDKLGCLI